MEDAPDRRLLRRLIEHHQYSPSGWPLSHDSDWPDLSPLPSLPEVEINTETAEAVRRLVRQLAATGEDQRQRFRLTKQA